MTQRRASIHNRCKVCRIKQDLCVCEAIKSFDISTVVSMVVHVRELKLTSNTAQFVQLMLPQNAQTFIRGKVFENFTTNEIVARPGRALFLYPAEDSVELNADFLQKNPGPYHLVVPDGNWHQARRVRKREDDFKAMPAVRLPAGITSEYQLRRAPQPEWVSTYESIAHALGIIEGEAVRDQLMTFFRIWVKRTMFNRTGYEQYL